MAPGDAVTSDHVEPEWALVTIAFVDIRGFTTFADRATARAAVDHLNGFFELAVPIVEGHGGSVNKLLGDGLLAVFGMPDHADRALAASLDLLGAVEERYRIGIGLNSGLVLVGTIGGGGHSELGVVGDPVNVSARVQDATRELGEPLLLTEATRGLVESPQLELKLRGALALRGKREPVSVYVPLVTLPGRPLRRKEPAWRH
jgi:adenylate cyclase